MTKYFATVLLALASAVVLVACGGGGGDAGQQQQQPPPVQVHLWGDSILAGYGVQITPVERMRAQRPAWVLVDHAANGAALHALLPGLAAPPPGVGRYVVLEAGFVDAYQGLPGFEQDLRAAVQHLLDQGRVPILTGVPGTPRPPPLAAAYNTATHAVAREHGLQHAGWGEAYAGEGDVVADGIHRTQAASDRLAALLVAAIERAVAARP